MAQYRCSVQKAISRGKAQSAIAKAAYNARDIIRDDRTGEMKDFSRKHAEVLFSGIFVDPKRNAPAWAQDRPALWNAASAAEKRKDAREAQEIIVNLPHELTDKQRQFMLTDFVREQITRGTGRIADVNIHAAPKHGDDRNVHAHILMTVREIGAEGFGKRLPEVNAEQISRWKEKWAERGAKELEKAGFQVEADRWRVGHLSLERQRQAALERGDLAHAETLDREPTKHLGPHVASMERKGIETERGNIHRDTIQRNADRAEMRTAKRELEQLQNLIEKEERQWHDAVAKAGIEKEKIERRFVEPRARGTLAGGQQEASAATRPYDPPENLQHTAAEIWVAYGRSPTPQDFAATLQKNGMELAAVTKDEAERSHREAEFAKAVGNYAPRYREAEIVAVSASGHVYQLNSRTTGEAPREVEKFMAALDRSQLQGIEATKQVMHARAAEHGGYGRSGRAPHEQDILDRTERRTAANENAARPREVQHTVLDRTERRTMANEKAQGPRNTRDR